MSMRIRGLFFMVAAFSSMAAALAAPGPSPSQYGPLGAQQQTPPGFQVRLPDSKKQVKNLFKTLKLNSDQRMSVQAILAERDRTIDLLSENGRLSEDAKNARINFILVECNRQIAAMLNERQRKRFDEMLARTSVRQNPAG
jgi:hypothetical protein